MFVKNFEFPESSAIFSVNIDKNSVKVVYNSNIDKEYTFDCQDIQQFEDKLSQTVEKHESVGKFFHICVKEGQLVPVTK
jgi:hypothetical protein